MKRAVFHRWIIITKSLLWVGVAVCLPLSCGIYEQAEVGAPGETGSVTFSVKWEPSRMSPDILAMEAPAAQPMAATDVCTLYSINQVNLEIWRDGTTPTSIGVSATEACSAHTAMLSGVPAGVENLYVILTTTPEGWYGESARFTLGSGETEDLGTLTVGLPPIEPPWQSPVIVNTGSGEVTDLEIAMDGSGNAIAVWGQDSAEIYASLYSNGLFAGWGTPTLLDGSGDVGEPAIAMDNDGNGIVVWTRGTLVTEPLQVPSVYVNHYTPLSGWDTPALLASSSRYPQIAMSSSGAAFAVWQGLSPNCSTRPCLVAKYVYASRYTSAGGWVPTGSLGGLISGVPRIAMDNSGNAVAVRCSQSSIIPPVTYSIQANSYTSTDGWSIPVILAGSDACDPDLAMDTAGNAVAVWKEATGNDIGGTWFTPLDGWGSATILDGLSGDVGFPEVAMDATGTAIAVWEQLSGGDYNIYGIRYTPSGGWGSSTLLEQGAGNAGSPQIAMDGGGNAMAVWRQEDVTNNSIYASEYTTSSGWGGATLIEQETGSADLPRIAMFPLRSAIAVWKINGVIYANQHSP